MLFNSYIFVLIFLPAVLALWWGLGRWPMVRLAMLVLGSYLFYGWWHWEFTLLLLASTLVDYYVGFAMARTSRPDHRKILLAVSLVSNLGMLGYFKYCGFLAQSINGLLETFRFGAPLSVPDILLPAGISFYTFQTLTYSIDLYRGQIQPAQSLLHFAAYVSMFPQLIAGPIVRYSDVELQMERLPRRPDWDQIARGIWFFVVGMSQKILIADSVASVTNPSLADLDSLQFLGAWSALLGYTIQLYFDFAGYSNMAIGLGLFLGFEFPQNFDSPYKSTNIQQFWRRWHMTLSSFLRDYLYIPMGGSRFGQWISCRNLLIVMILGGIWHGAGWTFVLWGVFHGVLLVSHSLLRERLPFSMPSPLGTLGTLLCVMIGWLLFRSTSLEMAWQWFLAITGCHGFETNPLAMLFSTPFLLPFGALLFCWVSPNTWEYQPRRNWVSAIGLAILLLVCILRFDAESPFLYFQF
jgi:alginate O-acetyltransferase complex protein AlgI